MNLATLDRADGAVAAHVVVLPTGAGYLTSRLAPLRADRTYQLWATGDGRTVSLGVLGPHPTVVAFTLVGDAHRLAVTDEAAGGVAVSHQPPTATGELPST